MQPRVGLQGYGGMRALGQVVFPRCPRASNLLFLSVLKHVLRLSLTVQLGSTSACRTVADSCISTICETEKKVKHGKKG